MLIAAVLWFSRPPDDRIDTAQRDATAEPGGAEPLNPRLGGFTTTFDDTERAFNRSARNLGLGDRRRFGEGDRVFEAFFGEGEGLGPTFSGSSCTSCHVNNGRSRDLPDGEAVGEGFAFLTDPETDARYGTRVDPLSIDGEPTEPTVSVVWVEQTGTYDDGTTYRLRRPVATTPDGTVVAPRMAPTVIGTGLLEAIPDERLLELADPDDADGDGISGTIRMVEDPILGETIFGRFGWKASTGTVLTQTADAFENDMGIETGLISGVGEISPDEAELAAFYSLVLAVPAMRNTDDPDVLAGSSIFTTIGCASCHTATHTTEVVDVQGLSEQTIFPYTDLLLHDLGPDLAESATVDSVDPSEWRTPPLWGLGLHDTINGNSSLLHDGRARNPEEAILWHGGEAEAVRDRYLGLPADERDQLLRFLDSL